MTARWLPTVPEIPGLSAADLHSYVLGLAFLGDHGVSLAPYGDLFDETQGGTQEQLTAVLAMMRLAAKEIRDAETAPS